MIGRTKGPGYKDSDATHILAKPGEIFVVGPDVSSEDVENRRRVCFLGYEVARRLFSNSPAVGEAIRINGTTYEVIGVMPNKAQISNYFYPDKLSVFIPYTVTARKDYVDNILFQALTPALHEQAVKQVRELLATRHRFNPRDDRAVNIRDTGDIEQMIGGHSFFSIDSGRATGAGEAGLSFADIAVLYRTDAQSAASFPAASFTSPG